MPHFPYEVNYINVAFHTFVRIGSLLAKLWYISSVCLVVCQVLGVIFSLSVILLRKRELVAFCVLCPFLVVPWVGLQVAYPGHTHLRFTVALVTTMTIEGSLK